MEEATLAFVAGATAMMIRPIRDRVVPVAKAVGRTGRDIGVTAVAGFGQVVETARHSGNGHGPLSGQDQGETFGAEQQQ